MSTGGIYCVNTSLLKNIQITGNNIRNVNGSGISLAYASQSVVSSNNVYNCTAYGIYITNSSNYNVSGNILDTVSIGVGNDTGNSFGYIGGNNVSNSTYGILMNTIAVTRRNNFTSNTSDLSVSNGYDDYVSGAAPIVGTWNIGNIVWNSSHSSAAYIGWVCTVSGTPGTWKTFGLIS